MPAPKASRFQQIANAAPKAGLLGVGLDVIGNTIAYKMNGDSTGTSFAKGALEGAYFMMAPHLAITTQFVAPMAGMIARGAYNKSRSMTDMRNQQLKPGTNFTYKDSRAAYTMRQASVQAIQGSKLNARNALGGEAAMMHRSYVRK